MELLKLNFEVIPSDVVEIVLDNETPEQHVLRLSSAKSLSLAQLYPEAWIIGADTIVVSDGIIMGKPATRDEAKSMLRKLSGQKHEVYTGINIRCASAGVCLSDFLVTKVIFKDIPPEELDSYVMTEEPYDKAGAYALQGMGAFFIREIEGSYTNVIGLPLCEVVNMLKLAGAIEFSGEMQDGQVD